MLSQVCIRGIGLYLPEGRRSAKEIAKATQGLWTEEAIIEKLGIRELVIPGPEDGTQEMGVKAALDCLRDAQLDPKEIDLILCFGEEWKEYPLTTSALYIQDKIGAVNAWGIDVQNRCCTTIAALKIAKDMLLADADCHTVLVCGGYRNGDFVNYADPALSMMYNLGAGAGALLLQKCQGDEGPELLGTHVMADGSLARTAGVEIGGIAQPIHAGNLDQAYQSLRLMDEAFMKQRLREVSMKNWFACMDKALEKSGYGREDITYLNVLHMKRSAHLAMLETLGLEEGQSQYFEDYGHIGQVDMILGLSLARKAGQLQKGSIVCSVAAGIGYVWAANIIRWGA